MFSSIWWCPRCVEWANWRFWYVTAILVHSLLGFAAGTVNVTMDFTKCHVLHKMWTPLLFRFLLRTQKLRVMMERMIQPSVRFVAEVTARIACCCVMAVMQGKKSSTVAPAWLLTAPQGLASVWSTGTIWFVGCPLLFSLGSLCGQTCIHVLMVQTSWGCDGSFSGDVAACVESPTHISAADHWNRWPYLQVMKMFVLIYATSGCKDGKNHIVLCLL